MDKHFETLDKKNLKLKNQQQITPWIIKTGQRSP